MGKYYWNGEEYTWKQLLFAFYTNIANSPKKYHYDWKSSYYIEDVNEFFKDFRHNDNDKRKVFNYGMITYYWIKPTNIVWDSYNRIIPSGFLKQEFLKYIPNETDRKPRKISKYRYRLWCRTNTYEFRNGPVPNIHKWKNGNWHKYRGDHGHTIQELKQCYCDLHYLKEVREEYGVGFKINRRRNELDPWNHGHHAGCHGYGWKRSKKSKQWMKHGWKEVYIPFVEEEIVDCWDIFEDES